MKPQDSTRFTQDTCNHGLDRLDGLKKNLVKICVNLWLKD